MDTAQEKLFAEMLKRVGLALYQAQSMEKELAFLLIFPEIQGRGLSPSSEECSKVIRNLDQMTFGSLKNKLKQHFSLNEFTENRLQEALDKRNFLAHHFFNSHSGKLNDTKELEMMLRELVDMFELFREVYHAIAKETGVFLKKTGVWTETGEVENIFDFYQRQNLQLARGNDF